MLAFDGPFWRSDAGCRSGEGAAGARNPFRRIPCPGDAQLSLGTDRLARRARPELGERDYRGMSADRHPVILGALTTASDALVLCEHRLPRERA